MSAESTLVYYPDTAPGIRRLRCGRGFSYVAPDGTRIDRGTERSRLEAMAVPPAYDDVWMTPLPNGHLWATGRDARARKQYRYHPDWRAAQEATKFDRLADFGAALPRLRAWTETALDQPEGSYDLALAVVIALLDRSSIRVGNPAYTRENHTFGATTLRRSHVRSEGGAVTLRFRAKGGMLVRQKLQGVRLNRAVQRSAGLAGATLAAWTDDAGRRHAVRSEEVNDRIAELTGERGSAKTFRSWNGTLAAFRHIAETEDPTITAAAEAAAEVLHNSPAMARKSYIHPRVLDLIEDHAAVAGLRTSRLYRAESRHRAGEAALLACLGR